MSGATKAGFIGIMAVALLLPGVFFGVAQGQEPIRVPKATQPLPQPTTKPMTQSQQKILGSLTKTGEVRMEKINLKVDMRTNEAMTNPYATVKKVLEQNGIPVNGLTINTQTLMNNHGETKCYHVVYPEAEKSNTICL
jgi:hypothetical protein